MINFFSSLICFDQECLHAWPVIRYYSHYFVLLRDALGGIRLIIKPRVCWDHVHQRLSLSWLIALLIVFSDAQSCAETWRWEVLHSHRPFLLISRWISYQPDLILNLTYLHFSPLLLLPNLLHSPLNFSPFLPLQPKHLHSILNNLLLLTNLRSQWHLA